MLSLTKPSTAPGITSLHSSRGLFCGCWDAVRGGDAGRMLWVPGMGLTQPGRTSYNDPQVSFQFHVPRKPLLLTSLADFSSFETEKIRKILHSSFQQEKSPKIQRRYFVQYLTHLGSWNMVKITKKKKTLSDLAAWFLGQNAQNKSGVKST